MSLKRACPALMLIAGRGPRHRQLGVVEHAGDEFADAIAVDRYAEFDRAAHGVEHARIETGKLRLFERDRAEAGERTDERRRAAADALELGLQREAAADRRPFGTDEHRAGFGVAQPDA